MVDISAFILHTVATLPVFFQKVHNHIQSLLRTVCSLQSQSENRTDQIYQVLTELSLWNINENCSYLKEIIFAKEQTGGQIFYLNMSKKICGVGSF